MVERFPDGTDRHRWVAADDGVRADHATDPLNGLATPMSNRFINDFVLLYDEVNDGWADGIDAALPVLIVAGELDPVANYGEGAFHVANSLWSRGSRDGAYRRVPGRTPRIHNEPPTRALVEGEIIAFVESHL